MNLEVMRGEDEVRVIRAMQVWQRVLTITSPLILGCFLLTFYQADRLSHWDIFESLPGWVPSTIYALMAAAFFYSVVRAVNEASVEKTEWIFRVGQSQMVRHYLFGLRKCTVKPVEIYDIELYERKLDGPDLFRVGIDLKDQKLDLPWTQSEGERDSLATQLSHMFPQAEIDELPHRQPDHHGQ